MFDDCYIFWAICYVLESYNENMMYLISASSMNLVIAWIVYSWWISYVSFRVGLKGCELGCKTNFIIECLTKQTALYAWLWEFLSEWLNLWLKTFIFRKLSISGILVKNTSNYCVWHCIRGFTVVFAIAWLRVACHSKTSQFFTVLIMTRYGSCWNRSLCF